MVAGRIQSLVRGGRNAILDLANLKAEWIPRNWFFAGGAVPPDSVTATPVAGSGALSNCRVGSAGRSKSHNRMVCYRAACG